MSLRGAAGVPAWAALVAALLCAAAPGRAQEGGGLLSGEPEVRAVRFEGNRAFPDDTLAAAIATEETRCRTPILAPFCLLTDWGFVHERAYLDEDQLAADVLRLTLFYRRRGYREARVDTAQVRQPSGLRLTFRIEEGAPVRIDSLRVEGGEEALPRERLPELLPVGEGDPLDLTVLDDAERRLTSWLQDRGYAHAMVFREYFIPSGTRAAEVTLRLEPGPVVRIGELRVRGNRSVEDGTIRSYLALREGDLYSQERILESQRNLYGVEALGYANVTTELEGRRDTLAVLTVDVTEADLRTVRTGIGATTTDCIQAEASFTHRNFLGGTRRLEVTTSLANILAQGLGGTFPCTAVGPDSIYRVLNYQVNVEFRQPNFFSARNQLTASVFGGRETVPRIFVRTSRGAALGIRRQLRTSMPVGLTYRPELTAFDERSADVFFCVNFGFCVPEDIAVATQERWLAPVTASWSWDRTNATFSPTAGYYASSEIETAGELTGSDYAYYRFLLDAADFGEVAPDVVLGVHLRAGALHATGPRARETDGEDVVVHPRKRFFAGGPQSVRGFQQNLLGPKVLVVNAEEQCGTIPLESCVQGLPPGDFQPRPTGGNALLEASMELRYRFGRDWEAVAFLDAGQVSADLGSVAAPVATPGAGLRFFSPVGPLRLDVGYDPTGVSRLPVVAELADGEIRDLAMRVRYAPYTHDDPGPWREFFRRLQVHLSIGEAF